MPLTLPTALRALALIPLMLAGGTVRAAYPDKPIRPVVISVPGGATDIVSRLIAQQVTGGFGQQIVIDNRPGTPAFARTGLQPSSPIRQKDSNDK